MCELRKISIFYSFISVMNKLLTVDKYCGHLLRLSISFIFTLVSLSFFYLHWEEKANLLRLSISLIFTSVSLSFFVFFILSDNESRTRMLLSYFFGVLHIQLDVCFCENVLKKQIIEKLLLFKGVEKTMRNNFAGVLLIKTRERQKDKLHGLLSRFCTFTVYYSSREFIIIVSLINFNLLRVFIMHFYAILLSN